MSRFRSSAPKAKNGFVAPRIVSSPAPRRNSPQGDVNDFSGLSAPPLTENGVFPELEGRSEAPVPTGPTLQQAAFFTFLWWKTASPLTRR